MHQNIGADDGFLFGAKHLLVMRLHRVRQHGAIHAIDLGDHLKRVALDLGGQRAAHHQSDFAIVADRADEQRRSVA